MRRRSKKLGCTNPILVGSDDVIIAGNARLLAAQKLGMTKVPVIVLGHPTPAQRKALVLADNNFALNAGWDENLLPIELEELQSLDFELGLTGFDSIELDELLRDPMIEKRADEAPPLPDEILISISGTVAQRAVFFLLLEYPEGHRSRVRVLVALKDLLSPHRPRGL